METKLKNNLSNIKTSLILSVLSIVSGILCGIMGEIFLFLPIGFLAALYLFDKSNNRVISIVTSVIILILNIAGLFLQLTFSVFAPASITLAFIIFHAFKHKESKSNTAFLLTMICGVFNFVSYIIFAMMITGKYTFSAAIDFYTTIATRIKEFIVPVFLENYAASGVAVTEEMVLEVLNAHFNMIISYLFIGAFFVIGIGFKLFGFIVKKCAENTEDISSWRFLPSSLYAYLYMFLVLISVFLIGSNDLMAIVVLNLYNIFQIIFVYVGFISIKDMLRTRFSSFISFLLPTFALFIFSYLAIQIFAIVGVLFTTRKNKEIVDENN